MTKTLDRNGPNTNLTWSCSSSFLRLDGRLFRIAAGVERDQIELIGPVADLEAAGLVDLVDRDRHALRRHISIDGVRPGLRLDLSELDRLGLRRCYGRNGSRQQRTR